MQKRNAVVTSVFIIEQEMWHFNLHRDTRSDAVLWNHSAMISAVSTQKAVISGMKQSMDSVYVWLTDPHPSSCILYTSISYFQMLCMRMNRDARRSSVPHTKHSLDVVHYYKAADKCKAVLARSASSGVHDNGLKWQVIYWELWDGFSFLLYSQTYFSNLHLIITMPNAQSTAHRVSTA